ncbi:MAG: hypothetical protein EWV90_06285 [Microcystis aeruginosa Ma_QC_Ch_20071001_M135]|nr:MAG: hypothetical protein EWV90_06285 [Microcystis aeruginosa Ma_QC_Ch_20071001_M135]
MFLLALISRSWCVPQSGQSHSRTFNGIFSAIYPQLRLRFLSIVCDLERTNQLNLLPDQDLVDLGLHIESYQVTKNHNYYTA